MHIKSDNTEIIIEEDTHEIVEELFDSVLLRYQTCLEQFIKGSNFVFYYIDGLDYKCHKISIICGGSYIDSPE